MNSKTKINIFFSTLVVILAVAGYSIITTLFLPQSIEFSDMAISVSISRRITIPYRAFLLIITFIVIFFNFKYISNFKIFPIKILLFFWLLYIIRISYDLYLGVASDINVDQTSQLWLCIGGSCIPIMLTVIYGFKYINLDKCLFWIIGLIAITLTISVLQNTNLTATVGYIPTRDNANLALNAIAFGHLGVTEVILCLFVYLRQKNRYVLKFMLIIGILLGLLIMLRAGSRGPVLTFIIILLFWVFSRGKNLIIGSINLFLIIVLIYIFFDSILDLLSTISPMIEARIQDTFIEGDIARKRLYIEAFDLFLDSPIWGSQYAIFMGTYAAYSHNIILDALMGLGIIGGFILIYLIAKAFTISYRLIKKNDEHFWICLILIQIIISCMTSGNFYMNVQLSTFFALVFIYNKNKILNIHQNNPQKNIKELKNMTSHRPQTLRNEK